jgi:hypothetical protein
VESVAGEKSEDSLRLQGNHREISSSTATLGCVPCRILEKKTAQARVPVLLDCAGALGSCLRWNEPEFAKNIREKFGRRQ